MNKSVLIGVTLFLLLAAAGCAAPTPTDSPTEQTPILTTPPLASITPDFKNTTYLVEETPIVLVNGVAEEQSPTDSTVKITTRYFGNEAFGDLNGDGKEDVAFLLTQNSSGSGTFYYVVAALVTDSGYQGTNAIFLGDRIAPQTTTIENGMVIVNYSDRKADEPFTTPPSVAMTKYFKIMEGKLININSSAQITQRKWQWVNIRMNDDTVILPEKTDAFTITFNEDGSFTGTTDCNNFFGNYQIVDNQLTFDQFASTKMACQNSQEDEFLKYLGEVDSFLINQQDNTLVLLIKYDSGSMLFK